MRAQQDFDHWDIRTPYGHKPAMIPNYVFASDTHQGVDAVIKAIEKANQLKSCGVTPDGTDSDGRKHYHLTFGIPIAKRLGGGYSVELTLWVAVYPLRYKLCNLHKGDGGLFVSPAGRHLRESPCFKRRAQAFRWALSQGYTHYQKGEHELQIPFRYRRES